jgi:transposase
MKKTPPPKEVPVEKLGEVLDRAKTVLDQNDYEVLASVAQTLTLLTQELSAKRTTLDRLRKMLFGATTEKTKDVLDGQGEAAASGENGDADKPGNEDPAPEKKRPGHGRNAAAAHPGARQVKIPHPSLHTSDKCPGCEKGKVYLMAEPAVIVRITGMVPFGGTVYTMERLRCNLCGEVFTAPSPAGVGEKKYDETAVSMLGLLKYGLGLPLHRIHRLQKSQGIPLPATTQWDLLRDGAKLLSPAHEELIRQAAQGEVLYNDDTTMKILNLTAEERAKAADDKQSAGRTGVFTSGIVATCEKQKIALFFTGVKHAGENLSDVLARREPELAPPIQMCDALSRNTSGDFETILSHCIAHARRQFVDVVNNFPAECKYVLETLGKVYKNDAATVQMTPEDRLAFHQAESEPLMKDLEAWLKEQIEEHRVEPNSGLGEAIGYMHKYWQELTLFLRVAGAPLDNNLCERAIKKAILHRKNSLFYKTLAGARVGDVFMSLIHTAELNGANPFEYLVALQRHSKMVGEGPADWMPWNYTNTLASLPAPPS